MKETEEMENEEIEESEEGTEEESSLRKENKIELDFSMDAIERIKIEAESAKDGLSKAIGAYLADHLDQSHRIR